MNEIPFSTHWDPFHTNNIYNSPTNHTEGHEEKLSVKATLNIYLLLAWQDFDMLWLLYADLFVLLPSTLPQNLGFG